MDFVNFDTFKFVSRLEQAGMSREQAAAVLEAQQAMFSHALENTLATKRDIARLEKQIDALDVKFSSEIIKLDAKFSGELLLLKWMIGVLVALSVANFAKQFF
jgi:DNA-binding transcriptional MerR regulator